MAISPKGPTSANSMVTRRRLCVSWEVASLRVGVFLAEDLPDFLQLLFGLHELQLRYRLGISSFPIELFPRKEIKSSTYSLEQRCHKKFKQTFTQTKVESKVKNSTKKQGEKLAFFVCLLLKAFYKTF